MKNEIIHYATLAGVTLLVAFILAQILKRILNIFIKNTLKNLKQTRLTFRF